jgi:hypothetical protein
MSLSRWRAPSCRCCPWLPLLLGHPCCRSMMTLNLSTQRLCLPPHHLLMHRHHHCQYPFVAVLRRFSCRRQNRVAYNPSPMYVDNGMSITCLTLVLQLRGGWSREMSVILRHQPSTPFPKTHKSTACLARGFACCVES